MELKTFQSKYYHNKHSEQRDAFLIKNFGEEWLNKMKEKGYFQGDWPDEIVGTLKGPDWKSKSFGKDGKPFKNKEVYLDASSS